MTKRLNNMHVKKYMSDFNNYKKLPTNIKNVIIGGTDKGTSKGLNQLYIFICLKELDIINTKNVERVIDNFRAKEFFNSVKKNMNSIERKYFNDNLVDNNGNYNIRLIKSCYSTFKTFEQRTYQYYNKAINEISKNISDLLNAPVVNKKPLTKTQKQSLKRIIDSGVSLETINDYLNKGI